MRDASGLPWSALLPLLAALESASQIDYDNS